MKLLMFDTSGLADHIRLQLRTQGLKLPGHAVASLERTRRGIIQLKAAGVIRHPEWRRMDVRFNHVVRWVLHRHGKILKRNVGRMPQ
jgi:hypothetical protein